MADEGYLEVIRQYRNVENSKVNFLLTAAGAAIALVINLTQNSTISLSQLPLLIATLLWGLSIYFGIKHRHHVARYFYNNLLLIDCELQIKENSQKNINQNKINDFVTKTNKNLREDHSKYNRFSEWQFNSFIFGAISFIIWHILEMVINTIEFNFPLFC